MPSMEPTLPTPTRAFAGCTLPRRFPRHASPCSPHLSSRGPHLPLPGQAPLPPWLPASPRPPGPQASAPAAPRCLPLPHPFPPFRDPWLWTAQVTLSALSPRPGAPRGQRYLPSAPSPSLRSEPLRSPCRVRGTWGPRLSPAQTRKLGHVSGSGVKGSEVLLGEGVRGAGGCSWGCLGSGGRAGGGDSTRARRGQGWGAVAGAGDGFGGAALSRRLAWTDWPAGGAVGQDGDPGGVSGFGAIWGSLRGTPGGSSGGRAGLGSDREALPPVGSTEPDQGRGVGHRRGGGGVRGAEPEREGARLRPARRPGKAARRAEEQGWSGWRRPRGSRGRLRLPTRRWAVGGTPGVEQAPLDALWG